MDMQSALVLSILKSWQAYEWTVQGFGFIRTKIENVGRIHIWDSRLAIDLVSTVHNHPWKLQSTIISGELINQRFRLLPGGRAGMLPYWSQTLKTGEGGGLVGEAEMISLEPLSTEFYGTGNMYSQEAQEIHRTMAQDGTVTLLQREQGPPLEETLTFWPSGTVWVSAEPKVLADYLISQTVNYALQLWNA